MLARNSAPSFSAMFCAHCWCSCSRACCWVAEGWPTWRGSNGVTAGALSGTSTAEVLRRAFWRSGASCAGSKVASMLFSQSSLSPAAHFQPHGRCWAALGRRGARLHQFLQARAHAHQRERVQLRDARLADAQDAAHFLHGQFFQIVEGHHLAFLFFQRFHGLGQKAFQLRLQALEKGIFLRPVGLVGAVGRLVELLAVVRLQGSQVQPVQFAQQLLKLEKLQAHFLGHFQLRGGVAERGRETAEGFLHGAGLLAQPPRAPVGGPQAVQDGPADAEFGVGFQLHVARGIELVHRVDQPQHTGVHQVFERNLRGQALVNAPRDVLHLGQVLGEQLLALRRGERRGTFGDCGFGFGFRGHAAFSRVFRCLLGCISAPFLATAPTPWRESPPATAR